MKKRNKVNENVDIRELLNSKEPAANMAVMSILIVLAVNYLLVFLVVKLNIIIVDGAEELIALFLGFLIVLIPSVICAIRKGKDWWIKYMMMASMMLSVFAINIISGYKVTLFYALAMVIACRYNSLRVLHETYITAFLCILASTFTNAYLPTGLGYRDLNMLVLKPGTSILVPNGWLYEAVEAAGFDKGTTIIYSLKYVTSYHLIALTFVMMACLAVVHYGQRNMVEAWEMARQKGEMEVEIEQSRTKIMISQIRPHFLYNTLSAIMAIDDNPDETIDALGDFSKYLRENLDVLTEDSLTPFMKELLHVRRYISLEQLRFGDRIKVSYDLQVEDFKIPALTVQMLAENAIKHGISKKMEGGTLLIATRETEEEYQVIVKDDGLGFDVNAPVDESRSHVGLGNVRSRLEHFVDGWLQIASEPGKGTVAVVHIPKSKSKEKSS